MYVYIKFQINSIMPYDVYSIYQSVHIGTLTLYVDCFLNTTIQYILIDILQYVKCFFSRLQIINNFFNIRLIIKLIKNVIHAIITIE